MDQLPLNNYLEELKKRKIETKARDLREEIAWRYLDKLKWSNETFFRDYDFFWPATKRFWKSHTPTQFEKVMEWAAEKEVHVRGIASLLIRS